MDIDEQDNDARSFYEFTERFINNTEHFMVEIDSRRSPEPTEGLNRELLEFYLRDGSLAGSEALSGFLMPANVFQDLIDIVLRGEKSLSRSAISLLLSPKLESFRVKMTKRMRKYQRTSCGGESAKVVLQHFIRIYAKLVKEDKARALTGFIFYDIIGRARLDKTCKTEIMDLFFLTLELDVGYFNTAGTVLNAEAVMSYLIESSFLDDMMKDVTNGDVKAFDFFMRNFEDHYLTPGSHILLVYIVEKLFYFHHLIALFIGNGTADVRERSLNWILELIRTKDNVLTVAEAEKEKYMATAEYVNNKILEVVNTHLGDIVNTFRYGAAGNPSVQISTLHLSITELFLEMIRREPYKTLSFFDPGVWSILIRFFFVFRNNNIYHAVFFRIISCVVGIRHYESLKIILDGEEFLELLLKCNNSPLSGGIRPHLSLLASLFYTAARYGGLAGTSANDMQWDRFEELISENDKNVLAFDEVKDFTTPNS